LTTLETRRIRADLIEVYKIFKGLDRVEMKGFFPMSRNEMGRHVTCNTRGHEYKLQKRRFRTDVVKHNFGNRVVNAWSRLPDRIVKIEDFRDFKGE
jgi:hypothetical protein